jgi:ribosomal protein S18 acetylase RimI-like enzyme
MAAHENLGLQFNYSTVDVGERKPIHRVQATTGPTSTYVGEMVWSGKEIRNIGVSPDQQRRGIATRLYEHAQGLAAANPRIPAPKHSKDRTTSGDAWAQSVGGRLPRRKG